MAAVFVHGDPGTAAVWDPLFTELERAGATDLVRLSPPGFGAPSPAGFGATVSDYRDWLIGELARFGEPVDLVGHGWGGAHVLNVVMSRPDLVDSWVSDVVGIFDPGYVWHEAAQRWQTVGIGDADVAARLGLSIDERVELLVECGMSRSVAEQVAKEQDGETGRAVLALHRSAAQPAMARLGRNLERAARTPGLALLAAEDETVGSRRQRSRAACRTGAWVQPLDGLGHWWMIQDPERMARVLTEFWAALHHR